MALSLISQPSQYASAYRPVQWEVETNVVDLFKVRFTLKNNVTNATIATADVQGTFGDLDNFKQNFEGAIQDNLGVDIENLTVGGVNANGANIIKDFRIEATEQILVSGAVTDGATIVSDGRFIVNSTLTDGDNDLVTQGYFTTVSGTKLLTNKPNFETRAGESEYIALFNNSENVKVTITATDNTGAITTGVVNSITAGSRITYLGIGYSNINSYVLSTGTQPLLTENSVSYTVQFETVTTGTVFELVTVNIVKAPCETNKRFHFQNVFGAIDSFTLTGYDSKAINIDSTVSVRTNTDVTNAVSFGRFKSNTLKESIFQVGTQNITQAQRIWLEEMLSSSNVYLQDGNNYLPIIINTDSFDITTNKFNEDIFTLEFEYQLANSLRRQKN